MVAPPGAPRIGEMILYDYIRPALLDGSYRLRVETEVAIRKAPQPLDGQDFFFEVQGPRFALAPDEVAGVFPPRNGHGAFDSALPHVALGRRTLPWERPLAAGPYTAAPEQTPFPFLALVLFEQSECQLEHQVALTDVVPQAVYQRLGSPAGIRCDAVRADQQLIKNLLPMPEELQLLTHVRQVNIEDRELAAGDSDGFFAVVMSNRIPSAGKDYVACLVSVEERTDLLPTTDQVIGVGGLQYQDAVSAEISDLSALSPGALGTTILPAAADRLARVSTPATGIGTTTAALLGVAAGPITTSRLQDARPFRAVERERPRPPGRLPAGVAGRQGMIISTGASMVVNSRAVAAASPITAFPLQQDVFAGTSEQQRQADPRWQSQISATKVDWAASVLHPEARLVLLHSWTFSCDGDGTFRQLMQQLDVGMIGDVDPAGKLAVTDTGHIMIDVTDRLGAPEQSWYRGPFVTQPLSRDPLGPYHSADQARRVVADTGAENISYAAAFEAGRLLAAADGRLAQELMRWRRGGYSAAARAGGIQLLTALMRLSVITDPLDPVALHFAVDVLDKITGGAPPVLDRFDQELALGSPLLQSDLVAKTFALRDPGAIGALLGAGAGLTSPLQPAPALRQAADLSTLRAVLADSAGMAALTAVRSRAIGNITGKPTGPVGEHHDDRHTDGPDDDDHDRRSPR